MKISIIGLGYIGLPTAALIASHSIHVIGVDVNSHTVETINQGKVHIVEPDLDGLVHKVVSEGFLTATLAPEEADAFILAVPTPFKCNNEPDISHIEAAAKAIAPRLKKGNLVILESTSPVGTTEKMLTWLNEARPDLKFPRYNDNEQESDVYVAYCPERVLPGHILRELVENDRIIGGVNNASAKKVKALYEIFIKGECMVTNSRTAEMSKLVENSYRDVNIAFANELSMICDRLDINVWDMIKMANHHPRVNILQPGPGVGGHCIAVDPWFIVSSAREEAKLIATARRVNDAKPQFVLKKIEEAIGKTGKEKSKTNIACLGLSFKPNVDDLRESPALNIALAVTMMGFQNTFWVEPNIKQLPVQMNQKKAVLTELKKAVGRADIVVLLVDHKEFISMDMELLSGKVIVDTRGVFPNKEQ